MDFLHSESLPAQGLDLLPLLLADITAFSPACLLWQQPGSKTVTTLHRNQTASCSILPFHPVVELYGANEVCGLSYRIEV